MKEVGKIGRRQVTFGEEFIRDHGATAKILRPLCSLLSSPSCDIPFDFDLALELQRCQLSRNQASCLTEGLHGSLREFEGDFGCCSSFAVVPCIADLIALHLVLFILLLIRYLTVSIGRFLSNLYLQRSEMHFVFSVPVTCSRDNHHSQTRHLGVVVGGAPISAGSTTQPRLSRYQPQGSGVKIVDASGYKYSLCSTLEGRWPTLFIHIIFSHSS